MKKVKFGMGGILMLSTMIVSDSAEVFVIYLLAALFHEVGHLLTAKLLGIGIKEIRFEFSGVRICTEEGLISYAQEFLLAFAGPLFNLIGIGGVFLCGGIYGMTPAKLLIHGSSLLYGENGGGWGILGLFALSSAMQAMTNLMPVKSFDGGRMLYSALAVSMGDRIAERVLTVASTAAIFTLWTVALYLMLRISSGLGIYVFAACMFFSLQKDEK